jgi:hypothetical protein
VAYADLAAVKARAGRLAAAWAASTTPSDGDVTGFLADTAAEIDALLAARGLTTPATGAAASALRGLNADGALALALTATWPGDDGPSSAKDARADARSRWEQGIRALAEGRHPAVALLESSSSAPAASDFWSDEPTYGQDVTAAERALRNPFLAPEFERGQAL